MLQESDGVVTVATALVPDQTLTVAKIVGTIPVEPVFARRAVTGYPIGFTPLTSGNPASDPDENGPHRHKSSEACPGKFAQTSSEIV